MAQITGDPVIGTFNGNPGEFDLLSYIDDSDLMDQLGINAPSPVMGENNLKLIDGNPNEYITLQPSTPQQDLGYNVNQTCYYAIDTEEVSGFQGIAEVSDTSGCDSDSRVVRLDETSRQTTAADSNAHIVINTSDNASSIGMETNDSTPPVVLNALEPTLCLAQETTSRVLIITGDSYNTPVNFLETQPVIPVIPSMSPGISLAPMETVISCVSEASPSIKQPNTPFPVPSGKNGQSKPGWSLAPMETVISCESEASPSIEQPNTPFPVPSSGKGGQSKPRSSRRPRAKKPKKYEITQELCDPMEEKKRLNAINAKKNRDRKKNKLNDLAERVAAVTRERDQLQKEVEDLKKREKQLREALLSKNYILA